MNVFIALKGTLILLLFKTIFLKFDFTQFFHDIIHEYSPGAVADSPQGTNCLWQQKCLVTSFVTSFKKMSLKSDFIHFFFFFL